MLLFDWLDEDDTLGRRKIVIDEDPTTKGLRYSLWSGYTRRWVGSRDDLSTAIELIQKKAVPTEHIP